MSASAGVQSGTGGMMSGGIMNLVQNWLTGGQQGGTALGQETPTWDFPQGADKIPDDIRSAFFRSDFGPTGFNEFLQQMKVSNPGLVDRFRAYVNGGLIRPTNAAAQQTIMANGGYQAGDMTPLGTMINGMPSGLNEQQLGVLANIIGSGIQYNLGLIEASGYLDGMPTLDRENIIGQLAQGWMEQATNQFLANETQRSNKAQEGLSQQEITNQNIQSMAEIFGGMMQTDPATGQATFQPTEKAREFDTTQSGWLNGEATLSREQQAFNQAKDVANLASNPRNYIEAQMLSNARGGLTGMEPNNQIQQTTFGPATTTQQPQFQAPGGPMNQMQNLATMQGQDGLQREMALGGQGSAPGASPQAMSATGQYNLNNPATWAQMGNQAGGQWNTAQQGLAAINGSAGFQGLMPQAGTPGGPGPGAPPWPGLPAGWGNMPTLGRDQGGGVPGADGRTSISPFNPATGMRFDENTGQYTSAPMPTADENYRRRMAAMGMSPDSGEGRVWAGGGPDASGRRFDESTGQYTYEPMPTADQNYQRRMEMFRQQQPGGTEQVGAPGQPGANGVAGNFGQMGQLGGWQGWTQPFQPSGGVPGMDGLTREGPGSLGRQPGVQPAGQGNQFGSLNSLTALRGAGQSPAQRLAASRQDVAGANQGAKFGTSNFTQSLLQNRVVPKSGGLNTAGREMTEAQMKATALANPNKIRTQDYLRGEPSQQQGFQAAASFAGGFSGDDLQSIMQKNLPSFKAPGAGRMI